MGIRQFLKDLAEPVETSDERFQREQFERAQRGTGAAGSPQRASQDPLAGRRAGGLMDTGGGGYREPGIGSGMGSMGSMYGGGGYRSEPDSPLFQHQFRPRVEFVRMPPCPQIFITDAAYKRICLVVEAAPKEVGWLGTVDRLPDGNFRIDEIFVPEQEVTGSETDPSMDGLFNVMNDLVEMGEEGMQKIERLRFWGHSHVRMMTSPSGTDENTPLAFRDQGLPWFVRGIFNKLGRAEFTVYLFEEGYRLIDVPWSVVDSETGSVLKIEKNAPRLFGLGGSALSDREAALGAPSEGGLLGARRESRGSSKQIVLPAQLVPTDAERKAVKAELAAKLKERSFAFFGGFGKRDDLDGGAGGDVRPDDRSERDATSGGAKGTRQGRGGASDINQGRDGVGAKGDGTADGARARSAGDTADGQGASSGGAKKGPGALRRLLTGDETGDGK